jgi:hypothetical protein
MRKFVQLDLHSLLWIEEGYNKGDRNSSVLGERVNTNNDIHQDGVQTLGLVIIIATVMEIQ